jgi:hypothetical protein
MFNLKKQAELRKLRAIQAAIAVEFETMDRLTAKLQDGNRMEFKPYCEKWGLDYESLMTEAREKVARDLAENRRRMAERRASGLRY